MENKELNLIRAKSSEELSAQLQKVNEKLGESVNPPSLELSILGESFTNLKEQFPV